MDIQTSKIILYIVIAGVALFALFRKLGSIKRKCIVCEVETSDTYMDSTGKLSNMCRAHLVSRWKDDVLASNNNMVVIEPDIQDKNHSMGYMYADIKQLGLWQYGKSAQDNMSKYLDLIVGKDCEECGSVATVAYFKKEDYEIPFMEKISTIPKYLCKNCMIKKITPILVGSQYHFYEGLYAPTSENGVYHSQEF